MRSDTLIIGCLIVIVLAIIALMTCDLNLNWRILYIPIGVVAFISTYLMSKFNSGTRHIDEIAGGREEKRESSSNRPRLSFETAHSHVSPDFLVSTINHPKGFELTLIDESPLIGGSKQRALIGIIADIKKPELVYAGPSSGYAQVAIAYCSILTGKTAKIFIDMRDNQMHKLSFVAKELGASIICFDGYDDHSGNKENSRLKQIQKRAESYVARNQNTSYLLPFGMDNPVIRDLYEIAFAPLRKYTPNRLWIVAGSGMIFSTLARIWPNTKMMIIQVGKTIWPDQLEGINSQLFISPYAFSERITEIPPYNTLMNYDAKVWPFILEHGEPGDFVWNTAGEPMDINKVRGIVEKTNLMLARAKQDENALVDATSKMTMPMFRDAMPDPKEMFKSLCELVDKHRPTEIVSRNFSSDYTVVDGISNHFTEAVRMNCIVNRSDRVSPYVYWQKYRSSIAREAFWLGGSNPSPLKWRDAMNALKCYECGTFNPIILVNTIKRYFPDQKSVMMLDPSSGWGDRLIAALACQVALYVGFDPNIHLAPCYAKIKADLAPESKTVFIADKYSNALIPSDIVGKFDLAFTSPPFFNEEIYVGTEADVAKNYEQWLTAIYEPYLRDMARAIRPDGIAAVYIDNVPRIANMANDTTRILHASGLSSVETLLFRNDTTGINGITHSGHPRSLWVFKKSSIVGGRVKMPVIKDVNMSDSPYPRIQEYRTTLDDEIERLRTVEDFIEFVTNAILRSIGKEDISVTRRRVEYESRNIVERYLLTSANHAAVEVERDPVLVVNPKLLKIFQEDLQYKFPMLKLGAMDWIINGTNQIITGFVNRRSNNPVNAGLRSNISYRGNLATFTLGGYERDISKSRIQMLLKRASNALGGSAAGEMAVIKMLTRYATIISGPQHWEAPLQYFKVLYALGVRFEGFSSPVNSQFIRDEFPDTRICTLFPDTDRVFGSIGGFFHVDFLAYYRPDFIPMIVVGPPYYNELILSIARRVIDHCDRAIASGKKIRFIITHSNSWDLSEGFNMLNTSQYKRIDHVYPAGEHFYNNDRGEQVIARFATRMFMLDAGLPEVTVEYKKTLLAIFPEP